MQIQLIKEIKNIRCNHTRNALCLGDNNLLLVCGNKVVYVIDINLEENI